MKLRLLLLFACLLSPGCQTLGLPETSLPTLTMPSVGFEEQSEPVIPISVAYAFDANVTEARIETQACGLPYTLNTGEVIPQAFLEVGYKRFQSVAAYEGTGEAVRVAQANDLTVQLVMIHHSLEEVDRMAEEDNYLVFLDLQLQAIVFDRDGTQLAKTPLRFSDQVAIWAPALTSHSVSCATGQYEETIRSAAQSLANQLANVAQELLTNDLLPPQAVVATAVPLVTTPTTTASADSSVTLTTTAPADSSVTPTTTAPADSSVTPTTTASADSSVTPTTTAPADSSVTPPTAQADSSVTPPTTASADSSVTPTTTAPTDSSVTPTTTAQANSSVTPTTTAPADSSVTPTPTAQADSSVTPTTTAQADSSVTPTTTAPADSSVTPTTTAQADSSVTPTTTAQADSSVTPTTTAPADSSVTLPTTAPTDSSVTPPTTARADSSVTPTTTASADSSVTPTTTAPADSSVTPPTAQADSSVTPTTTAQADSSVTPTTTARADSSVTPTTTASADSSVTPTTTAPADSSVTPTTTARADSSVTPPTTAPAAPSVTPPTTAPVASSVTPPTTAPVAPSVTPPTTAPVASSVTTPTTAPVAPLSMTFRTRLQDANENLILESGEIIVLEIEATYTGARTLEATYAKLDGSDIIVKAFSDVTTLPVALGTFQPGETKTTEIRGRMPLTVSKPTGELVISLTSAGEEAPVVSHRILAPLRDKNSAAETDGTNTRPDQQPSSSEETRSKEAYVAVLVGMDAYRNDWPDAYRIPTGHMKAVGKMLQAAGAFTERNIRVLEGSHAAKSDVEEALFTWGRQRIGAESVLLVYFAGQAVKNPATGEVSLVPYEGSPDASANRLISLRTLQRALGMFDNRLTLLLLDTPLIPLSNQASGSDANQSRPVRWDGGLPRQGTPPIIQIRNIPGRGNSDTADVFAGLWGGTSEKRAVTVGAFLDGMSQVSDVTHAIPNSSSVFDIPLVREATAETSPEVTPTLPTSTPVPDIPPAPEAPIETSPEVAPTLPTSTPVPDVPPAPEAPTETSPAVTPTLPTSTPVPDITPAPEAPTETSPAVAPTLPTSTPVPDIPPAPEAPIETSPEVAPTLPTATPVPDIPPAPEAPTETSPAVAPTLPTSTPVPDSTPAPETPTETSPEVTPTLPTSTPVPDITPAPEAPIETSPEVTPTLPTSTPVPDITPAPEAPTETSPEVTPTLPTSTPVPDITPAPEAPTETSPAVAPTLPTSTPLTETSADPVPTLPASTPVTPEDPATAEQTESVQDTGVTNDEPESQPTATPKALPSQETVEPDTAILEPLAP